MIKLAALNDEQRGAFLAHLETYTSEQHWLQWQPLTVFKIAVAEYFGRSLARGCERWAWKYFRATWERSATQ